MAVVGSSAQALDWGYEHNTLMASNAMAFGLEGDQGPVSLRMHDNLFYAEAVPGQHYRLNLINRSDENVLVMLGVDGKDPATGKSAGFTQKGFVIRAHEVVHLEHNNLVFSDVAKAYPGPSGTWGRAGQVRVGVFKQRKLSNLDGSPLTPDNFVRKSFWPDEVLTIQYDTNARLNERGVRFEYEAAANPLPN